MVPAAPPNGTGKEPPDSLLAVASGNSETINLDGDAWISHDRRDTASITQAAPVTARVSEAGSVGTIRRGIAFAGAECTLGLAQRA
jgi:hypothetical protein